MTIHTTRRAAMQALRQRNRQLVAVNDKMKNALFVSLGNECATQDAASLMDIQPRDISTPHVPCDVTCDIAVENNSPLFVLTTLDTHMAKSDSSSSTDFF